MSGSKNMDDFQAGFKQLLNEVVQLKWKLEAQKVLITGLIGIGGDKAEDLVHSVRDEVYAHNAISGKHVDEILARIVREDRKLH